MGDLLSTSVTGLLAFQQALDVTSNNVANASTPGYAVETPTFDEIPPTGTSGVQIGNGVEVTGVTRAYSELLAAQVRSSQSSYSSLNTLSTQASQIDNLLSASSSGLTATLQSFSNALQSLASSPSSSSQRQVVLSQAQALAQQIQSYSSQVSQYGSQLESQLGTTVNQINSLASNIATLNAQIVADSSGTGQTPNELLDQRDEDITQLSQYVTVNTATESDGAMDVYIGSGQGLVVGSTAAQLATIPNAYDASQQDIGLVGGNVTTDITSQVSGGELGGLLAARSQVIEPTQNALGQVSVALASLMNQQQAEGMDQTGAAGQPMFNVGAVQSLPDSHNTGSATVSTTITSLSGLTSDNYELEYTGAAWQLTDETTGQQVTMSGNGTAASPFQADGLSIVVSGAPASGDSYLIEPTAAAAAGFSVALTSPTQIAAASLVQSASGAANTGSGTISASVTNPAAYVPDTYTITFSSATQYQVTNSGGTVVASGAYTSGSPIDFEGAEATVSGTPAAGDTFTVSPNSTGNTGDNSNVLAMISALASPALAGGTTSVSGAANNLVSQVGVITQQSQAAASAQQSVNQDAVSSLNNLSGVNLDQEAANLVTYQQAYQACAQMITASSQMFTSLMDAFTYG
jgi:flagellar hook-associated protein 1